MKSELIANVLKYYRKQEQLSVSDVVLLLRDKNIKLSPKTIYAWENGTTKPDVPTLMVLCSLYRIPNIQRVLDCSGEASGNVPADGIPAVLTEDELLLVEQYRRHPEMREAVRKLLE